MSEQDFTDFVVRDPCSSGRVKAAPAIGAAGADAADGFLLPELMGAVGSDHPLRAEVAERLLTVWLSDLSRQLLDLPPGANDTLEQIRGRLQAACSALEHARQCLRQRAGFTCASADGRS